MHISKESANRVHCNALFSLLCLLVNDLVDVSISYFSKIFITPFPIDDLMTVSPNWQFYQMKQQGQEQISHYL